MPYEYYNKIIKKKPVVQPSLGEMALMQGMVAEGQSPGYSAGISQGQSEVGNIEFTNGLVRVAAISLRYRPFLENGSDQLFEYRRIDRQCIQCHNQLIRTIFEERPVWYIFRVSLKKIGLTHHQGLKIFFNSVIFLFKLTVVIFSVRWIQPLSSPTMLKKEEKIINIIKKRRCLIQTK